MPGSNKILNKKPLPKIEQKKQNKNLKTAGEKNYTRSKTTQKYQLNEYSNSININKKNQNPYSFLAESDDESVNDNTISLSSSNNKKIEPNFNSNICDFLPFFIHSPLYKPPLLCTLSAGLS